MSRSTDVPVDGTRDDASADRTTEQPAPAGDTVAPARAWRAVLEHLERLLLAGELGPGDHLAPERQLAADLGVSRSSVREAVRVLDALGLVRTATGSGPTAGAVIVASPTGGMSAVMRLQVAAQGFPIADIVEARLVVEPAIAAHLARAFAAVAVAAADTSDTSDARVPSVGESGRHADAGALRAAWRRETPTHGTGTAADAGAVAATGTGTSTGTSTSTSTLRTGAPDLGQASALLDAMEVADLTPAEFLALDARFHVALAEASGNTVLSATMAGLRDSIEGYVLAAVPALPSWTETAARLRTEHREIVAAIERGASTDAARRLHAHVAGYYAESRITPSPRPRPSPHARSHAHSGAEDQNAATLPRKHADSAAGQSPRS